MNIWEKPVLSGSFLCKLCSYAFYFAFQNIIGHIITEGLLGIREIRVPAPVDHIRKHIEEHLNEDLSLVRLEELIADDQKMTTLSQKCWLMAECSGEVVLE